MHMSLVTSYEYFWSKRVVQFYKDYAVHNVTSRFTFWSQASVTA